MTTPTKVFVAGTDLPGGKPAIRFHWSGIDTGSGAGQYRTELSIDGRAYAAVGSPTAATLTLALATGHSYRIRVRAVDRAGNVGAWSYGSTFELRAYQETSRAIHWTGPWHAGASTSYWGGAARYARAAGAKASLTFNGRTFAWIGAIGPTRGWARVYVNGTLVASINLHAANAAPRRILFATSWSTARSRTVTVRLSGTPGHPRGDVDAFVVGS